MKISSVILAIVLWFFVTSRGQSEITMDIPLELKNIPQGLESVRQGTKSVSVSIRGQERLMRNIKPSSLRVYIDLNKAKRGKTTYYINKDDVKVPATMAVASISPSTVWIVLEETAVKTVPVVPVIIGNPKKGFVVASVEVTPREAVVRGTRAALSSLKSLRTEPVDVTDANATVVQEQRLDLGGKNIWTEVQEVSIKAVIKRAR